MTTWRTIKKILRFNRSLKKVEAKDVLSYLAQLIDDRNSIQRELKSIDKLTNLPTAEQNALASKLYDHFEDILCPAKFSVKKLRSMVGSKFDVREIRLPFVSVFLSESEQELYLLELTAIQLAEKVLPLIGFEKLQQFIAERTRETILSGTTIDIDGNLDFSSAEERFLKLPPPWLKLVEKSLLLINDDLKALLLQKKNHQKIVIPLTAEAKKMLSKVGLKDLYQQGVVQDLIKNLVAKDGTQIPVIVSASALRNNAGDVLGAVVTAKDLREIQKLEHEKEVSSLQLLEEIKKSEAMAKKAELRIKSIFESVSTAVLVVNSAGMVSFYNKTAAKLLEFNDDLVLNMPAIQLAQASLDGQQVSDDQHPFILNRKSGKPFVVDPTSLLELKTFSGKQMAVLFKASPFEDDTNSGVIITFLDISMQVAIEKNKSEFISLAAHQLRTPLTSIRWSIESLLSEAKHYGKEHLDILHSVEESTLRLIRIVGSLLNLSQIESRQLSIKPQPTELSHFCKSVLKDFDLISKEKHHKLVFDIDKPMPLVSVDPLLLREVLTNILSNAIRYTRPKGVITLSVSLKNKEVLFVVSDNGVGIPKDQQLLVFEKFVRGKNIVKFDTEGSGLGLYLVKRLVNLFGGKVWFTSEEDKGSTFYFTIPVKGNPSRGLST